MARTCIILATGPSMSQELADSVRGYPVGVVNGCYQLAPWAQFLAANDRAWWAKYPDAMSFPGRRFSTALIPGVEQLYSPCINTNTNSGVLALEAAKRLGYSRVLLCGFDMHGTHYFGPYTNGLKNTKERRRHVFQHQFAVWKRANRGVEVLNCTPGSHLRAFPMVDLWEALEGRRAA